MTQLANTPMNVVIPKKAVDVVKVGRFTIVSEVDSPKQKSTAKKGGVNGGTPPYIPRGQSKRAHDQEHNPLPSLPSHLLQPEGSPTALERMYKMDKMATEEGRRPTHIKNVHKKLNFGSPSQNGGTFPYEGGSYVVHTGPRGGQFIRVKNKKIYLPKKRA